MTIEEMKRVKKERGYSFEKLSKLSGVPVSTIQKIWGGITKTPRYETLEMLANVLDNPLQDKRQGEFTIADWEALTGDDSPIELINGRITGIPNNHAHVVRDDDSATRNYGRHREGEVTIEEWERERENRRVELIDGRLYTMESATGTHQEIEISMVSQIRKYIRDNHGVCKAFSERDVQLDADNQRTIYEPDVIVVCDRSKDHNKRIIGAPDFVAEILSPSTKKKDAYEKLAAFSASGVREYWMINPKNRQIIVHDLEHDDIVGIYGFQDQVPMRIYEGKCLIDFQAISDELEDLYGPDWE